MSKDHVALRNVVNVKKTKIYLHNFVDLFLKGNLSLQIFLGNVSSRPRILEFTEFVFHAWHENILLLSIWNEKLCDYPVWISLITSLTVLIVVHRNLTAPVNEVIVVRLQLFTDWKYWIQWTQHIWISNSNDNRTELEEYNLLGIDRSNWTSDLKLRVRRPRNNRLHYWHHGTEFNKTVALLEFKLSTSIC